MNEVNWSFKGERMRTMRLFTKADVLILTAAFLSFLYSVSLWFGFFGTPNKEAGLFVGLWVPSIIAVGNYFRSRAERVK